MARLNKLPSVIDDLKNYPMPTPSDISKAEVAALTSKSLKDFAEFLEVDLITVKVWARKSKAFYNALNSWETVETFNIKKAMAKRAVGFTKTTKRDVITKSGNVETLYVETYYPPSETAGQFWLKNKAAEEFQDKREIDVNVNANIRAWLVSAGGQLDPSEIIDGIATEVIAAELKDNSQQLLEAELINDLIEEDAAETEAEGVPAFNLVVNKDSAPEPATIQPENNSPVSPQPGPGPSWQALNSKWT